MKITFKNAPEYGYPRAEVYRFNKTFPSLHGSISTVPHIHYTPKPDGLDKMIDSMKEIWGAKSRMTTNYELYNLPWTITFYEEKD